MKNGIGIVLFATLLLVSCGGTATTSSSASMENSSEAQSSSHSSSITPLEGRKVTGTFVDDWALSDNPLFFLWAWGGDISGMYYEAEIVEDSLHATIDEEITGLVVQRFAPDAETLPEDGGTTFIDDCWNKSEDIDVSSSDTFTITFIPGV